MVLPLLECFVRFEVGIAVIESGNKAERDAVAVEVIDAGPGLGAEELASVWDPFRSAAPGARALVGSGLGLAIVRGLVTSMGGSVTAASKLGKGSSFMVRLPRAQITV